MVQPNNHGWHQWHQWHQQKTILAAPMASAKNNPKTILAAPAILTCRHFGVRNTGSLRTLSGWSSCPRDACRANLVAWMIQRWWYKKPTKMVIRHISTRKSCDFTDLTNKHGLWTNRNDIQWIFNGLKGTKGNSMLETLVFCTKYNGDPVDVPFNEFPWWNKSNKSLNMSGYPLISGATSKNSKNKNWYICL